MVNHTKINSKFNRLVLLENVTKLIEDEFLHKEKDQRGWRFEEILIKINCVLQYNFGSLKWDKRVI